MNPAGINNLAVTANHSHYDSDVREAAKAARPEAAQSQRPDPNTVQTAAPPPPPPPSSPTSGGSSVTATNPNGYAHDPVAELKQSPEYRAIADLLNVLNALEDGQGFYMIDANFGGAFWSGLNDGKISRANIEAAAADPNAPGHAAANMLLANPGLIHKLDADKDNLISVDELQTLISGMKSQLADMEAKVRGSNTAPGQQTPMPQGPSTRKEVNDEKVSGGEAKPDEAGKTDAPPKTDGTADAERQNRLKELSEPTPRAVPSEKAGLDGATDNVCNGVDWLQKEIERYTNLAALEPEKAMQYQGKISMLNNQMQALLQMQNQLMTMMSNISKMFSDIAMNSIRNMR